MADYITSGVLMPISSKTRVNNVWAERYDRDLSDIFALQDEISEAIVKALKLKLLPEEKKAIEQRGTTNLDAYNLYLMARQHYATGNEGDIRRNEAIVRLCQRATEIDPNYAQAWALMALGQMLARLVRGGQVDDGLAGLDCRQGRHSDHDPVERCDQLVLILVHQRAVGRDRLSGVDDAAR